MSESATPGRVMYSVPRGDDHHAVISGTENHGERSTAGKLARWWTAIADYQSYMVAMGTRSTTIETRRQQLSHLARRIGVPDPWAVTPEELLCWVSVQEWAAETRRGRRTTFRGFWRWGVETGRCVASPALGLPRVRPMPPNPRPAPDSVYLPTLALADPRERLMLRLAAEQGLRRAEVAQVHTRDLVEDLEGWSLLVHGKGGRERLVPLTRDMTWQLRALPPGYAFPGDDHGHLSPRWVGKLINRLLPEGWTIHKLRHRAGTKWWEESGGDVFAVQELLGHADPKTTRVYVAVKRDHLRKIVNAAA